MATPTGGSAEEPRLKEHPLAAALAGDPSQGPPNATVLHGFAGKSGSEGCWRLYLDEELSSYVEICEVDVLHSQELPADAGTLVWVPKSLDLTVTTASSTTMLAEFLSGSIASGRMAPAAVTQAGHYTIVRGVSIP